MSRTLVILNPVAGHGAGERHWKSIEPALRAGGLEFDIARTYAPDGATRIASAASRSGYETLIGIGGDGTIHQIANGMLKASAGEPTGRLGIIPVGSGNDLIKTLGGAPHWRAGVKTILGGSARWIDVGRVSASLPSAQQEASTEYFVNAMDTGFGARVALHAHEVPLLTGTLMYLIAVLKELRDYSVPCLRIEIGGQLIEQRSTMVAVGNGRCIGGGFWITPQAEIDDGLLDICVAKGLTRIGVLTLLPKLMQGKHIGDPRVYCTRSDRIRVDSPDPLTIEADGEIPFVTTHHFLAEILPKRLLVLA